MNWIKDILGCLLIALIAAIVMYAIVHTPPKYDLVPIERINK